MSRVLRITAIDVTTIRYDYSSVRIILENAGSERVGPGQVLARQVSKDGSVRTIEFFSPVSLSPESKTRLTQLLRGPMKGIEFIRYRGTDGESIPLVELAKRGLFQWSLESA
jgi:hypothetical protein